MSDFRQLKKQVSVSQILAWYGLSHQLKTTSNGYVGSCPLHKGDNNKAFHIRTDGRWYCFTKCNKGGDLIEFIRHLEGGQYDRVAGVLNSLVHNPASRSYCHTNSSSSRNMTLSASNHKEFVPYTRRLRLMVEHPHFRRLGLTSKTLFTFEAGYWPLKGFLHNCIAVRVHNHAGEPLSYIGRRLDQNEVEKWGKWKFPRSFPKKNILYNYHRAHQSMKETNTVILVEGPWDVMKVAQAGFKNVVAPLGARISQQQRELIRSIQRVIIMFDGDETGKMAAQIVSLMFRQSTTEICRVPRGYDPAELPENQLQTLLLPFFPNQTIPKKER